MLPLRETSAGRTLSYMSYCEEKKKVREEEEWDKSGERVPWPRAAAWKDEGDDDDYIYNKSNDT